MACMLMRHPFTFQDLSRQQPSHVAKPTFVLKMKSPRRVEVKTWLTQRQPLRQHHPILNASLVTCASEKHAWTVEGRGSQRKRM